MIRALLCGFAVAALMAAVAYATAPAVLIGDGTQMLELYANPNSPSRLWMHVAVFPLARAIEATLGLFGVGLRPFDALLATSACAAGLGLGVLCLALWRVAVARREFDTNAHGAWLVVGLILAVVATSPALWLHARVIEVHSLQFAGAALGVALVALLSDRRGAGPRLGMTWAGVGFAMYACHRSNVLLFPGMLAAAWCFDARDAQRTPKSVARVAGLGMAFLLGTWAASFSIAAGQGGGLDQAGWLVSTFAGATSVEFVADELMRGIPGLLALFAFALLGPNRRRAIPWMLVCALPLVFFIAFGVRTEGGYFLGCVPALSLAAAASLVESNSGRRLFALACAALIALQIGLCMQASRNVERIELERFGAARIVTAELALPDGGTLLSADLTLQTVTGRDAASAEPESKQVIVERRLFPEIWANVDNGSEAFTEVVCAQLAALPSERRRALAFDRSWRRWLDAEPRLEPFLVELEASLIERFGAVPIAEAADDGYRVELLLLRE